MEVRLTDGRVLLFDAGSGLLRTSPPPGPVNLFLSHTDLGHVIGLPFWPLLQDPERVVRVYGPVGEEGPDAADVLAALASPPLSMPRPQARVLHGVISHEAVWEEDSVQVQAFRARHPRDAYGFRIRAGGRAVAYFPDNEIVGGQYDVESAWYDALVEFLRGVDVLIHDGMFTREEYQKTRGQGHSAMQHAVTLAEEADVASLVLFNHAPSRTDRELMTLLHDLRLSAAADGCSTHIDVASEGRQIHLSS